MIDHTHPHAALLRMTIAAGVEQRTREKEDKQDTSGSDVEGTQPEKTGSQSDESEGKEEDAAEEGEQEWGAPLTQTEVVPQRLLFGNKSPITVCAWEYARSSTWDPASDLPGYGFLRSLAYFFYIKTLCNHVQVSQSPNMTPITPTQPSPQRTHVLRVQLLLYIYHGAHWSRFCSSQM